MRPALLFSLPSCSSPAPRLLNRTLTRLCLTADSETRACLQKLASKSLPPKACLQNCHFALLERRPCQSTGLRTHEGPQSPMNSVRYNRSDSHSDALPPQDHELVTVGVSNVLSGALGGFTGSYIISSTQVTLHALPLGPGGVALCTCIALTPPGLESCFFQCHVPCSQPGCCNHV